MTDSNVDIVVNVQDVKLIDPVEKEVRHQDDALDEALDESFPASDPVAISITTVKEGIPRHE